jgi:hypothetical protein
MNTSRCLDEAAGLCAAVKPPSVEGGARVPATLKRRHDLSAMFVMRDLGMSGVAGGRRVEPLPLDRQAGHPAAIERRKEARTVALQDGLRITFSSADRLMEET